MNRTMKAPWRKRARILGRGAVAALFAAGFFAGAAVAQDKGTLNPQPLPPLAKPDDPATPAKQLFGRKTGPAPLQAGSDRCYPPADRLDASWRTNREIYVAR